MADSNLGAIAEVVPQISYDILGRIVPGSVVLVSLWVAAMGPDRALHDLNSTLAGDDPGPGFWAVLLWIALAYVLAIVLNGIWQLPACWQRWRCRARPPLYLLDPAYVPTDPSFAYKFEVVNQKLPTAGAWFTKLHAEMNLARVVAMGWTVAAAINAYLLLGAWNWPRIWLEVALLAGIAGALAEGSSVKHTRSESLHSLWFLLRSGELARMGIVSEPGKEREEGDYRT